jgi:hypothetical protein
LAEQ